jgi:hypothetical protein
MGDTIGLLIAGLVSRLLGRGSGVGYRLQVRARMQEPKGAKAADGPEEDVSRGSSPSGKPHGSTTAGSPSRLGAREG